METLNPTIAEMKSFLISKGANSHYQFNEFAEQIDSVTEFVNDFTKSIINSVIKYHSVSDKQLFCIARGIV